MPQDPLESLFNYRLVHVEAYIVHVDMVLRNEVAFKLTVDSIESLVEYHKEIHCVDAKAKTYDWVEKEQQCNKLHEDFVQAINKFVFRTHVSALEGLEEDGAGELLCGKSEGVKHSLMNLMKPLLPPPPRVVDVVRQPPLLPSSPVNTMWPQPGPMHAVDTWRVLPSSPSVTSTDSCHTPPVWANMAVPDLQMPSPTPTYCQPHSTAGYFFSTAPGAAPIPALPLPSMLAPSQCGVSIGMAGMGGFGWDRYQEYATIM